MPFSSLNQQFATAPQRVQLGGWNLERRLGHSQPRCHAAKQAGHAKAAYKLPAHVDAIGDDELNIAAAAAGATAVVVRAHRHPKEARLLGRWLERIDVARQPLARELARKLVAQGVEIGLSGGRQGRAQLAEHLHPVCRFDV